MRDTDVPARSVEQPIVTSAAIVMAIMQRAIRASLVVWRPLWSFRMTPAVLGASLP